MSEDLPNVYKWNTPYDLLNTLNSATFTDKYGIKHIAGTIAGTMLLFKVDGRYVLPNKEDEVQYIGNGRWQIITRTELINHES